MLEWFKKNGKCLRIKVNIDSGFNLLFNNCYRAWAEITWENRLLNVQGISQDPQKAIVICLSEFVERVVVLKNRAPTSSGFAAHESLILASENAENEILERDAYFCHSLTSIPFLPIDIKHCLDEVDPSIRLFLNHMKTEGVEIKFGKMNAKGNGISLIAAGIISTRKFHFDLIFETIYGNNFSKLIEKLCYQLAVNLRWFKNQQQNNYSFLNQMPPLNKHTILAQKNTTKTRDWFYSMFTGDLMSIEELKISSEKSVNNIQIKDLPIPAELLEPPLIVARAENISLQQYFRGKCTSDSVNLIRLSEFSGKTLSFSDLNLFFPKYS